MGKGINEEREFSESVERLLAGEEVGAGEDMSEDYRTAINFAKKLTGLRIDPSPQFEDQLRQRLLQQLTKQEVEARQQKERVNWFWGGLRNLIPQNPVWRTAIATLVIVIVTAGVLWRTGVFNQPQVLTVVQVEREAVVESEVVVESERSVAAPSPEMAAAAPGIGGGVGFATQNLLEVEVVGLEMMASPREERIKEEESEIVPSDVVISPSGEVTRIELLFRNVSSEPITVAPFPPAVQVVQPGTGALVRSFPEGDERLELSPSEGLRYTLVWDQKDKYGEQVAPGWYSVSAGDITLYQETEPVETHQSLFLTHLLIQFPRGAMEKVIELNQTETANDLSITLGRVELHAERVVFSAFLSSAEPPISARYMIDGVIKDAGPVEIEYLDNGIRLTWGQHQPYLGPVPSDAGELVFIIGYDWPVPWEFSIPLQD